MSCLWTEAAGEDVSPRITSHVLAQMQVARAFKVAFADESTISEIFGKVSRQLRFNEGANLWRRANGHSLRPNVL